jgi:hypothetical protein
MRRYCGAQVQTSMGHYWLINSVCPKAGAASMPDITRVASAETGAVSFFMVFQSPLFAIVDVARLCPSENHYVNAR